MPGRSIVAIVLLLTGSVLVGLDASAWAEWRSATALDVTSSVEMVAGAGATAEWSGGADDFVD